MSLREFLFSRLARIQLPDARPIIVPEADDEPVGTIPSKFIDFDCWIIDYMDASGRASTRRIAVYSHDDTHLQAHCFERDAFRTFCIDRIASVYNLDGEEVVPSPFIPRSPEPPTPAERMRAFHDGLKYGLFPDLVFLRTIALADGAASRAENALIADYLIARMRPPGDIDQALLRKRVRRWVANHYPTEVWIGDCADRLTQRGRASLGELLRACIALASADGHFAQEEYERFMHLVEVVRAALKEDGAET